MTTPEKSPMATAYERFFENQVGVRDERINLAVAKHTEELTRVVETWNAGQGLDFSTLTSTLLQATIDMNAILFEAHAGAVFAAVDVYLEAKGIGSGKALTAEDIDKAIRRTVTKGGRIN